MFGLSRVKLFVLLAIIVVVVASASAFAASNTVTEHSAGAGKATVSGYTVSLLKYNLDTADPTQIDSVEFKLDKDDAVKGKDAVWANVQLDSVGKTWYSCVLTDSLFTCDAPVAMSTTDELNIIASSIPEDNPKAPEE
jgi:hypothetical protein